MKPHYKTNSYYLIENDIAISASADDINWNSDIIAVPKIKAFSPSFNKTNTSIRCENNWYLYGAYEVELNPTVVIDPSYAYSLETADPGLETYIRESANSYYSEQVFDTDGDSVYDLLDQCPGIDGQNCFGITIMDNK